MPAGRPTIYKKGSCELAYKLALVGLVDKEIASVFGVSEQTLNKWKKAHPEFVESLKNGKSIADANVTARLYERAMGFEHDSEEIKVVADGNNMGSRVERVPMRKIYPPDTTAAIFWLKNRQKGIWRDKHEVEHSGEMAIIWNEQKNYAADDKTD